MKVAASQNTNGPVAVQKPKSKPAIQTKLMVNTPGDRYEQEADMMADRVVRMNTDYQNSAPGTGLVGQSIQRKCNECEEEDKKKKNGMVMRKISDPPPALQRSFNGDYIYRCAKCDEEEEYKKTGTVMREAEGRGGFAVSSNMTSQLANLRGSGSSLSHETKGYMESAFSTDFSHVRIHTDSSSISMNREVNAKAFTFGSDIYFDNGQYNPGTTEGKKLLAHELTHVTQQSSPAIKRYLNSEEYFEWLHDPSYQLINQYTSWAGTLDEDGLGEKLFWIAWQSEKDYTRVIDVINKLDSDDEDEVASAFLTQANTIKDINTNEPYIQTIVSTDMGNNLIARMYYAVASGHIADDEEVVAKSALLAFIKKKPLDQYISGIENAQILPFRPGGPFTLDDSPIMASLLADGNIRVHIPQRVHNTDMFKNEVATLDPDIFLTDGIVFKPDEIVGIRDYSTDGSVSFLPARSLILYSARADTMVINKIIEVSTFFIGGEAVAGATWFGKAFYYLDRAAMAIAAISLIVNDNRYWIINNIPHGKEILKVIDVANTIAGIYGITRLATGAGWSLIKRLKARKLALTEGITGGGGLANDKIAAELEARMDEITKNVESAREDLVNEHAGNTKYEDEPLEDVERLANSNDEVATAELAKREDKFSEWENSLDEPTQEYLNEHPDLKKVYEEMPEDIRKLFTHCGSICITEAVTREAVARVRKMIDRLGGITPEESQQLKILFHLPKNTEDLDLFLRFLEDVQNSEELRNKLIQAFRRRAMEPKGGGGTTVNSTRARNTSGIADGGENLEYVADSTNWLRGTGEEVSLIPKQVADKLRGKTFRNFKEFTEEFWKIVAKDNVLSQALSDSNRYRVDMLNLAPRVSALERQGGKVVFMLHHITPIEYGGGIFDLDNIAIVTPKFHHLIHD